MIKLVLRRNRKWNLVQLRGTFCQIGDAHSRLAANSLIHSCGAVAKPLSLMMSHFTSVWTWQDSTPRRPLVLYHPMVNLNWWSKFWNVSYCNFVRVPKCNTDYWLNNDTGIVLQREWICRSGFYQQSMNLVVHAWK